MAVLEDDASFAAPPKVVTTITNRDDGRPILLIDLVIVDQNDEEIASITVQSTHPVTRLSALVRQAIEDSLPANHQNGEVATTLRIRLRDVHDEETLQAVLDFCVQEEEAPLQQIQTPLTINNPGTALDWVQPRGHAYFIETFHHRPEPLLHLLMAADYLRIDPLVELASAQVAVSLHEGIFDTSPTRFSWTTAATAVAGGVGAVVATPYVLGAAGFTSVGIAANSTAAWLMSTMGGAATAPMSAGGVVATLQSVGAAGLGLTGTAVVGGTGAAAGAAGATGWNHTPPHPDQNAAVQRLENRVRVYLPVHNARQERLLRRLLQEAHS